MNSAGPITPVKDPKPSRTKITETPKKSENLNPNCTTPDPKLSNSLTKSAKKSQKYSGPQNPNPISSPSPRKKIRERKFVVAKKKKTRGEKSECLTTSCKCNNNKLEKCLCVAYDTLRASQEDFFRKRGNADGDVVNGEEQVDPTSQDSCFLSGCEENLGKIDCVGKCGGLSEEGDDEVVGENGVMNMKRRREKVVDKVMESVVEPRSGRVLDLVKAFENLVFMPKTKGLEVDKKGMKWGLEGLKAEDPGEQVGSTSFCPADCFVTSESLGLDSRVRSSLDSSQGSFTVSSRNSGGGQRSRRNSFESGTFDGRQFKRRHRKVTSQKPFNLRTEQRGRSKEEEFTKKVQEMMIEEEKLRIPVAQGLPWTTDEPECLAKPPVKECTRPVDLVLHSDVRAVERAEFDHQVVEKLSYIEQYRTERERQQKTAEEEELRRIRKELVPKAQPMPYFDRPFIPRRSERNPTIPKEPRFHLPHNKKMKSCGASWSEMYAH